jgi:hypothetical protein
MIYLAINCLLKQGDVLFPLLFSFAHIILVCQHENSRESGEAGFLHVGDVNFLGDNIVTCAGFCVTNKTGLKFDDRIYWALIQFVKTVHKSLTHCLLPTEHFTGTILTSSLTLLLRCTRTPLYSCLCRLVTPRHGPHWKHCLLSRMRVYWWVT